MLADKPRNGYSPLEVPGWTGLQALGLGCLTTEGFAPKQLKRVPDSPPGRRYLLQDGDLLMSRANTRELVGLTGRYRDIGSPCIYPDLMMRLRPDETQCLTSYLELVLQTEPIRAAVRGAARGTSESMVKISATIVEALHVPLPSLERQDEIVKAVASVDRQIERQVAVAAKLRTTQQAVVENLLTSYSKAYAV
ncbi:restriction endonuclease subunit S [Amycolatopsis sp. NPDC051061]|uniref:restriction endonuclease subunit S n=1 Tax=Amycolatopsis sp. NPDC051061 TaxID=3155042 RepID=UPI003426A055